jgi:hypothetical protein
MGGYISNNGCFRTKIPPNKFIDFKSFFLKCFIIIGLGLIILDSVYVTYRGVNLWWLLLTYGVSGAIRVKVIFLWFWKSHICCFEIWFALILWFGMQVF